MPNILNLTVPFFGLIAIGFAAGKWIRQPAQYKERRNLVWMNFFLVYVSLPALFYKIVSTAPVVILKEKWIFPVTVSSATFTTIVIAMLIARIMLKKTTKQAAINGVLAGYANIGYMGPGLVIAALGDSAGIPLALLFTLENIMIFTLVPLMMAAADSKGQGAISIVWTIIRKVALHPFILASLAGLISAAFNIYPPEPIDNLLILLKNAAAPCALFAMGVTLAVRPFRALSAPVAINMGLKLLVHPVLVCGALIVTGQTEPIWISTAFLLATLPTALNVYILAEQYDSDVEVASSGVLFSTIFSVITVSCALYIIQTGQFINWVNMW